jgi:predicted PurR-regulated permease PerM
MNRKWSKDDIKNGAIITVSLCLVVLFSQLLGKLSLIGELIGTLLSAMSPIIIGCVIAFLLCPIMNFFQKHFTKKLSKTLGERKAKKIGKALSVFCSILVFILLIVGLLWILIPELSDSVTKLYSNIPAYIKNLEVMSTKITVNNTRVEEMINALLESLETTLISIIKDKFLPNMNTILVTISSGIVGSIKFVMNFLVGIIVAIYILGSKEEMAAQCKKVIYSVFSKKTGNTILDAFECINNVFGGFINGKIIDAFIIGIICAIFCCSVKMPYAVLISVVVGVTNLIPFFGPFIGAIPSALLVLVDDPQMCIVFVIFIVILQQVDGNIIGPLILGDSTGLSALWIMFAILVGGNLFGLAGMILGVPVLACIYIFVTMVIKGRLEQKGLTDDISYYLTLRRFDENTGEPIRGVKEKRKSRKKNKKSTE